MTVRRPPTRVGGALPFLGLVVLLGTAGCAGFAGTATAPATTAPGSTSVAASAASTTAAPIYELPGTCAALLTEGQVAQALGARLPGTTTYVVGEPEPGIGRTGRITCGYGVTAATETAGASDPLLEVSVFTYGDPEAAADRVQVLEEAQRAQGAVVAVAAVPGADAVLFSGPADTTLVATVGARTCALTLVPGLLDPAGTGAALETLATMALGPAAGTTAGTAAGTSAGTTSSPPAGRPAGTTSSAPTG